MTQDRWKINRRNNLPAYSVVKCGGARGKRGQTYRLWLVTSRSAPFGQKQPLATFKANVAGAQIAQAIGPFRQVLTSQTENTTQPIQQRYLLITPADNDAPELIQNLEL